MKERMLFVSLLLMALLLPMNSHAQNKDFGMWFSAPAEYAEYFCTERSNAFVIALLISH